MSPQNDGLGSVFTALWENDRAGYERVVAAVRAALSDGEYRACFERGAAMRTGEAVTYALATPVADAPPSA